MNLSEYDTIYRINETFHLKTTGCGCCADETTWPAPWGEKTDRRDRLLAELTDMKARLEKQLITIEEMRTALLK